jgi:hypothetical protein
VISCFNCSLDILTIKKGIQQTLCCILVPRVCAVLSGYRRTCDVCTFCVSNLAIGVIGYTVGPFAGAVTCGCYAQTNARQTSQTLTPLCISGVIPERPSKSLRSCMCSCDEQTRKWHQEQEGMICQHFLANKRTFATHLESHTRFCYCQKTQSGPCRNRVSSEVIVGSEVTSK